MKNKEYKPKRSHDNQVVDHLLREALRDDMPPEVEQGMKRQMHLFRQKMQDHRQRQVDAKSLLSRILSGEGLEWTKRLFKQSVLAFASIILLVLGYLLQATGTESVLAESVSSLSTAAFTIKEMRRADSMECTLRVLKGKEETLIYSYAIHRFPAGKYRVRVTDPMKKTPQTLWLREDDFRAGVTTDPLLRPVVSFLSQAGLEEQLKGKWRLKHYRPQGTGNGDCEWGNFTIHNLEKQVHSEITIDTCTSLPARIDKIKQNGEEKVTMSVHFNWNT